MNKLILHIAYFFLPLCAMAQQNLVYNGDYEQYSSCPTNVSSPSVIPYEITKCDYWDAPTYGTSDYFHSCASSSFVSTPSNFAGSQTPYNGNGYLGAYLTTYTGGTGTDGYNGIMWWEYVQGQLVQKLQSGKVYKFSMEVSLAEYSDLMISELGVFFSENPITSPNTASLTVSPQIVFHASSYFSDTTDWIHLETLYQATGTEMYLTIGNFRDNTTTDTLRRYNYEPFIVNPYVTYFYIDNVTLVDAGDEITVANVFTPNGDGVNDVWKLPFVAGESEHHVYIINRWGNLITEASITDFVWKGNDSNGGAVTDGVYFYKVSGTNISGFIQLIR